MTFAMPDYSPISSTTIGALAGAITAPNNTDNQSVTGLGFRPAIVMATGTQQTATGTLTGDGRMQLGAAISASSRFIAAAYSRNNVGTTQTAHVINTSPMMAAPAGAGSDTQADAFDFVSNDADGFTIDWLANLNTQIYPYLALGGISAKVGTFNCNTATGNQAITGVGFQPKLIILYTAAQNTTTGGTAKAYFCIGAATSSSNRCAASIFDDDALDVSDGATYQTGSLCFVQTSTAAVTIGADFVSMDSDGFTINLSTAPGSAATIGYIALGGSHLSANVGQVAQKNGTGTLAVTGVGFLPTALILFGTSATTLDALSTNPRMSVGFATSTSARNYCCYATDDASGTSQTFSRVMTTRCIGTVQDNSGTLLCEADLSSLDSDGFTLNWTTADGTIRLFRYIALRIA